MELLYIYTNETALECDISNSKTDNDTNKENIQKNINDIRELEQNMEQDINDRKQEWEEEMDKKDSQIK